MDDYTTKKTSYEDYLKQVSEKSQCLLMSITDKLKNNIILRQGTDPPENLIFLDNEQATIISRMTVQKGVREFMKLTTPQISMLAPRIRLYKSFLNKPNKPDLEFLFASHFRGYALSSETGNGYSYLGNVGLKSFEFINQGTDFATNYIYKCKVEIVFGNIEELTAKHYQSDGSETSFLDLLLPPKFQTDEDYFRLKAVVGFARPGAKIQEEIGGSPFDMIPEAIRSEIDSWNYVMFLERINYNINFEEDGSIEISIDFISSVDRTLESEESDILSTPEIKEYKKVVASLGQSLGDIQQKIKNEIMPGIASAPGNDFSPFVKIRGPEGQILESDLDVTAYMELSEQDRRRHLYDLGLDPDDFEMLSPITDNDFNGRNVLSPALIAYKDISDMLTKYRISLEEKLDERYKKIITNVVNNKIMYYTDIDLYKILDTITINTAFDETSTSIKDNYDFPKIITNFRNSFLTGQTKIYNFTNEEISTINENYLEEKSELDKIKDFKEAGIYSDTLFDIRENQVKDEMKTDPYLNKDKTLIQMKHRINFILLGDLLNSVLEILKDNGAPNKHYAIMLGDITYSINDILYRINLGDLPVTREIIMDWYNSEIFDAKRDSYTLRQFLVSLMRKIIPAVMNAGCWAENRRFSEEIEIKAFTLPKGRYEKLFSQPYNRYNFEKQLEGGGSRHFESDMDYLDLIYIKSQNFISKNLKGNPDEDFEKGIYHFYVASSTGLVRKIKFSKVDDANIIASNINKSVNKQKFDETTITTFYDIDMEMVGNTLLTPGQIIYVNPTLAGFGNTKNRNALGRKLGIGGYYDVLQVSSYISPGEFTTKIKAKWKGFTGDEVSVNDSLQKGVENLEKELANAESNRDALKKYAQEYEDKKEKEVNVDRQMEDQRVGSDRYGSGGEAKE